MPPSLAAASKQDVSSPRKRTLSIPGPTTEPYLFYQVVFVAQVGLALLSLFLSFMVELKHHETYMPLFAFLSCAATLTLVPTSYSALGRLLYAKDWRFYQPFRGGMRFVVLQIISWTLFAVALFVALSASLILRSFSNVRGIWLSMGMLGATSQIAMMVSMKHFQPQAKVEVEGAKGPIKKLLLKARMFMTTLVIYNFSTLFCLVLVLPFVFLPLTHAFALLLMAIFLYGPSYLNAPHITGRREWPLLRDSFIWKDVGRYFRGRLIVDFDEAEAKKSDQYMFAMSPHGCYPVTAFWAWHLPSWNQFFGHLSAVSPLGASIFHFIPVIRDFSMWFGSRVVSRHSFVNTLKQKRSVFMIPGGIAEMRYSKSNMKDIVVVAKHRGFIRLAVEQGVDIVPVFSFGETLVLDMIDIPPISDYLLKAFTSPIPYFKGWNWLQIPRPVEMSVVMAKPIRVDRSITKEDPKYDQYIEDLHTQFYDSLREVFEKYKAKCGHEDYNIVILDETA